MKAFFLMLMIKINKLIVDTFTDEESDINPYYPRFKSHQLIT